MENLPVEIKNQISNYLDDRASRFMRLASTQWFNIINYNNFTCYFTRSQSLKEISTRLSQYQNQIIGLTLLKSSRIDEARLIDSISVLTNLTSLSLDSYYYVSRLRDSWIKLTTLTKLKHLDIQIEYPLSVAKRLTHLTSLKLNRFMDLACADVAEVLALNSNLRELDLATRALFHEYKNIFASISNPSLLTKLRLDLVRPAAIKLEDEFSMSKLTNLKWLEYSEERNATDRCFPLGNISSLEHLSLSTGRMLSERFDQNTNLTYLEVKSRYATAKYLENISRLTKLESLSLKTPCDSNGHKFLQELTSLSELDLWYFAQDIHETLAHITSRQLKSLQITFAPIASDCDPIRHLTSLEKLVLNAVVTVNYSCISALTNLTTLHLFLEASDIDCLTHLTKLKELLFDSTANPLLNGIDFRFLPYLEMFKGPLLDINTFNSLESATNLTSLMISLPDDITAFNYSILTRLPLREFINNAPTNSDDTLWRALGQITTLEVIFQNLEDDEKLLYLTELARLTSLKINSSQNMTGKYLTALTSIQVLTFKSASSIFSSKRDSLKSRIEFDNLEMNLPYLYSKQL